MFHTLFDYKDENLDNNRQLFKNQSSRFIRKSNHQNNTNQNYYGKGNNAYDEYNKNNYPNNNRNNAHQFEQTKNKVKLIVYKNGFILNNGPFRDRIEPENEEFLEQVERGVIPHEIADKGINDLGILLINRKNEIFSQQGFHRNNYSVNNFGFIQNQYQNQKQNQNQSFLSQSSISNNFNGKIIPVGIPRIHSSKNMSKKIPLDSKKVKRQNISEPKDDKKDEKKFRAFSGKGKRIGTVNMQGLRVNKNLKNMVDIYQPTCTISIRLFNGEIAKCEFNYTQTLRDIYYHVRNISGSNNFYLLDGFPPRPLIAYDSTIYELRLYNSMLTQKIN
jgi:hypothetical protein